MAARFQRNLRLGEFNLLFLGAFLVAVALSTVGTFSDRMEQTMQEKTRALLGADAMVSSPRPIDPALVELAGEFDLEVAQTISFLSMVVTKEGSQLAGIRAVTPNYPLRGSVTLQPKTDVPESEPVTAGPQPGSVWAAVQLVSALSLEDDQSVELGSRNLTFRGTILAEPEGGAGMLRLAPRVIMNLDDAQQSGLLAPGSRARYRLLFAGEETSLQAFEEALLPILKDHENWQLADIRRDEVRGTIGDGRGEINIDTGSGSVKLLRTRS